MIPSAWPLQSFDRQLHTAALLGSFVHSSQDVPILDRIDQQILSVLVRRGRITNRELAQNLGISESATHERWRRLEESGVIEGYGAFIRFDSEGRGGRAWLHVSSVGRHSSTRDRLLAEIGDDPSIVSVVETSGVADFMVQVSAQDLSHVRALQHRIEGIAPEDIRVTVSIVLETWSQNRRIAGARVRRE